jgi:hypothetical protein
METLLALALVLAQLLGALALAVPALRKVAAAVLVLVALLLVGLGVSGPTERELTTEHTYAGFEGNSQEISVVAFPTGTVRAPGWQWPLPFAAFAAIWAAGLLSLGQRLPKNGFVLPLLFAWTGLAMWLGMQALAAPAALVQPIGIDRVLWPAGLAMALLVARYAGSLAALLVAMSLGTIAARLPAALWSKYASDHQLGTSLDISSIWNIVNPLTQHQFQPPLELGSGAQQFWLIWAEHVIAYPAFYAMSLGGIAFAAHMFFRHGK